MRCKIGSEKSRNGYNILTPSEYLALLDAIPKTQHRILVQTMMNTGMRYRELQAFASHLSWFDAKNNAISLPASFCKTRIDRTVHLTPSFSRVLSQYLREFKTLEMPSRQALNNKGKGWNEGTFKRWAQDAGLDFVPSPKTFRKSWESWLLMADYSIHKVAMSQGHTVAVSEHHYANLSPKLKSEMEQVQKITEGWGT